MTESSQPPQAMVEPIVSDEPVRRQRKFWLRMIWISIACVIIPPFLGLLGTVKGMVGAFGELSQKGAADPEAVAGDISVSLLATAGGLAVSLLAFFVLIGVLIRFFTLPKTGGVGA
ncbi:MAG: MotA/TolQ/ExbB proton channel family protein [Verrucomicrobiota bacterium]